MFIDKGRVCRSGLPTEAALKVLVEKVGHYDPSIKMKAALEAPE